MKTATLWQAVTGDRSDLLGQIVKLLADLRIRYCVIGAHAINAYAKPLIGRELGLVVGAHHVEVFRPALGGFNVEHSPHSIHIAQEGSDLRVQIQTDPRYAEFVGRARPLDVLGTTLMVASVEDLLQGKVWAAMDTSRRPSKRQKDLADISRLLDLYPQLRERVPGELLDRLL
ncbi:MAG: hypothetical protein AB7T63_08475 [Planctomycetota bacterium]